MEGQNKDHVTVVISFKWTMHSHITQTKRIWGYNIFEVKQDSKAIPGPLTTFKANNRGLREKCLKQVMASSFFKDCILSSWRKTKGHTILGKYYGSSYPHNIHVETNLTAALD